MRLSWSIDKAFRTAPAVARRERRPARRAWPATARVRLCRLARGLTEPGGRGRGALVALLFVYVTLAGFNCAHWCDVFGPGASATGTSAGPAAHSHHSHRLGPPSDAGPGVAPDGISVPLVGDTAYLGDCRLQAPDPSSLTPPVLRELPVAPPPLVPGSALAVAALAPMGPLKPALVSLSPPETPPRGTR